MEKNNPVLSDIYNSIWVELKKGVTQRKHPFHLCFFSTISLSEEKPEPETRIVILRDVDKETLMIRTNTDLRSDKVSQIKMSPITTMLFYDKEKKIQLRIKAESKLVSNEKEVEQTWNEAQEISKRCYYVPFPPKSKLEKPFSNESLDLDNENLGLNVFGLIRSKLLEIDYLNLNYTGHVRCKFELEKKGFIKSYWVVP